MCVCPQWVCSTPVHAGWQQELYGTLSLIGLSVVHWYTEHTNAHYKTVSIAAQRKNKQKVQPLDRFAGQGEGYLENTYTEKEAHNFITWTRQKLRAGTKREKQRERECVERETNNLVSISYLMFVVDVVYVTVVFIVLFPKEDEEMYSFTDTCSRHWVQVWVFDSGYCTLHLTSWTTRSSCSLLPLPDCLN